MVGGSFLKHCLDIIFTLTWACEEWVPALSVEPESDERLA